MSTTGERMKALIAYNHYNLEKLSWDSGIPLDRLQILIDDQDRPSDEEGKDLSPVLGCDGSYLAGKEEQRYVAYVQVLKRLEEEGIVETEAWIQCFIDREYDFYDFEVIMYNMQDEVCPSPIGSLMFLDDQQNDGLYLVAHDGKMVLATKMQNQMMRHGHKLDDYKIYKHVAFVRLDLEDTLLSLTRKIRKGELDV